MDDPDKIYNDAYNVWKADPTPAGNVAILKTFQPVIEGAIQTHIGTSSPNLVSRARQLTLEGLRSYNPNAGRIRTHLYNQLQGLKRINRQQTNILKVPERISLDRYYLDQAAKELEHELGREPSDYELSNKVNLTLDRIARVREYNPAVAEGTLENISSQIFGGTKTPQQRKLPIWHQIVYEDLIPVDQRIMEHALGLFGKRQLSNEEIARKLKVTPGYISQRKAKIQELLNQTDLSPFEE